MFFQGYQGEVNTQIGHDIPGAEEGAQMMQLAQVQLAQIASVTVSWALPQHVQQTANNSPIVAIASTAVVQQVQTPIKFEVPVFEGDSATSWLARSQRVEYQARACGFEAELTAAEGEGLSFGPSNVDSGRLRNAHIAWMTLINSCRGMTLEIVQRSEAPNGAWQNLESHYRAK